MLRFFLCSLCTLCMFGSFAQQSYPVKANYAGAARFSQKKQDKMLFSTVADVHWLKKSDRFWYMYETTDGKKWWIADPP